MINYLKFCIQNRRIRKAAEGHEEFIEAYNDYISGLSELLSRELTLDEVKEKFVEYNSTEVNDMLNRVSVEMAKFVDPTRPIYKSQKDMLMKMARNFVLMHELHKKTRRAVEMRIEGKILG